MKNGIQQTIGVIKSLYTTTKQRLLFFVSGQFRKTEKTTKKNWWKDNFFVDWIKSIFKKRQIANKLIEIMKLSENLSSSKEILKKIVDEVNASQFDDINKLIESFDDYLKTEIHTDGGNKNDDGIIIHKYASHETTGFEAHIYVHKENNNLCVKLIMPDTFGNNTIIEAKPNISTPLNKLKNNINVELNSINKQIEDLKNIDKNKIIFNVVKIDCPDRQYPNEFKFDNKKEFNTIQEAMEYAVDDVMGNG